MTLADPVLVDRLRLAYSAEQAAALAYVGHAASLRDPAERAHVRSIERDEWRHRAAVAAIMRRYGIAPSRWYECKFRLIGKLIGASCRVIGRFMPFFFAGRLESGNVCEYIVMLQRFHRLGIHAHDAELLHMGLKEEEHEIYFAERVADSHWLPLFARLFAWGPARRRNDVDPELAHTPAAERWCQSHPSALGASRRSHQRARWPALSKGA